MGEDFRSQRPEYESNYDSHFNIFSIETKISSSRKYLIKRPFQLKHPAAITLFSSNRIKKGFEKVVNMKNASDGFSLASEYL